MKKPLKVIKLSLKSSHQSYVVLLLFHSHTNLSLEIQIHNQIENFMNVCFN